MNVMEVDVLPDLSHLNAIAVDLETTTNSTTSDGISNPYEDRIVTLQVSDGESVWILKNNFISAVPILANPEVKKIGHNLKFDWQFIKHQLGVGIENIHDTLIVERTLGAGTNVDNDLGSVLARRCGVFKDKSLSTSFNNVGAQLSTEQLQYAATDVLYLHKIREQQLKEVSETGMGRILALENSIVPAIAQMELDGIGFDRDLWSEYVVDIHDRIEKLKHKMCLYLGISFIPTLFDEGIGDIKFNFSSRDQVFAKLLEHGYKGIDTRESTLVEELTHNNPNDTLKMLIEDLLAYRGWEKMLGFNYTKHVNKVTGNIHAKWNQVKAETGRPSCSNPNLQQVKRPAPGEPNLRLLFYADREDSTFVGADFSQQEPRCLAQISQDPAMLKAASETDIYAAYGLPVYGYVAEKGSIERHRLKTGVLADSYGVGPKKLAFILGISEEEAKKLQIKFAQAFPVSRTWREKQMQQVAQRGYVSSLMGRRRYIPDARGASKDVLDKFRNMIINTPVQGTAADITKEAMRRFYNWTKENNYDRVSLRLAVHDELVAQAPESQAEEVRYALVGAMESAMQEICPDVRTGVDPFVSKRWEKV